MSEQKEMTIINLGGSLIVPEEVDVTFLKAFRTLILRQIAQGRRFILITGGGRTARLYANAAKEISDAVTDEDRDWLGIHATRINAQLIRTIFREQAYPRINTNPHNLEDFYQSDAPLMIAAGFRPGWSTDYVTTLLAKYMGIKSIVNLSNITHIYDKDPKKHADAKKLDEISWADFRAMFGTEWTPGLHAPFDPVASEMADNENLEVVTIGGDNLEHLERFLEGQDFDGSVIRNS